MQTVRVHPGQLSGSVKAPASKSHSQRVLAALLARGGDLRISNPGVSADERVVMQVLRDAGYRFSATDSGEMVIENASPRRAVLFADFGDSALAARMIAPLLALQPEVVRLEASHQLRARPMDFLTTWMPQLGVRVAVTGGHLPASIEGPLQPRDISVDASLSSQSISGLLMAYAAAGAHGKTIEVSRLVSRQYVDLTLHVIGQMGLPVPQNDGYRHFVFPEKAVMQALPARVRIEGDWSGAAFLLVAGAIAGEVCVTGLDAFSAQPDKRVLEALMESEASLSVESDRVTVRATHRLRAFQFDATDCPDLFPPLAALACYADGTSVIQGVERLRYKESNRAASITEELRRLGADVRLRDDYLVIRGGKPLQGAELRSHGDHRIAMMCAVAALGAEGAVRISSAQAVEKSYPHFFDDLCRLGAHVLHEG